MTERSFTFFEIHLHDGLSFSATNTAPAIGGSGDGDSGESGESDLDSGSDESLEAEADESEGPFGGGSDELRAGAIIALVLVVALAAVAKYLRGGDDLEALPDLDESNSE